MARILIVDDETDIRNLISDILSDEGYETICAGNAADALKVAQEEAIDLAILDIWLEGCEFDGIGVLKRIKLLKPGLPVVMISGHGNIETAVQTIKLGAYDFIEKPFKAEKLSILVSRALELANLSKENKELKNSAHIFSEIEGNSKATKGLIEQIKLISPTNSRVMIFGESGVGKTVLARMIHNLSPRKNAPFIIMYAANLSEDKFEADLFGVDDGNKLNVGILEKVNTGTLFIKEIHEMPLKVQTKFLKIIQENQFQKIGSTKAIPIDIRLITATNKNLEQEVKAGNFNQSLYYRLNVTPISLLPLRERKEDTLVLLEAMNVYFSKLYGVAKLKISQEALALIQMYDWPGNVRQLKNLIEWLYIMYSKNKKTVTADDLPQEINNKALADRGLLNNEVMLKPLRTARNIFEKEYLQSQLNRFSGNISKTAEQVGMERTALHRKLRMLKIVE